MLKVTVHSEDIIGFHICAPKNIATVFMKQYSEAQDIDRTPNNRKY